MNATAAGSIGLNLAAASLDATANGSITVTEADAITLGNEYEISEYSRDDLIYTKDMLLGRPVKKIPVADPSIYDTPVPYYKTHS